MSKNTSLPIVEEINLKIYIINTSFVLTPRLENEFSTRCHNVLTAISTSTEYPDLNARALAGLVVWNQFHELCMRSRTDVTNKVLTKEKDLVKKALKLEILGLVWDVMSDGNNDPERMTRTTGLTIKGIRTKAKPIAEKPDFQRYLPSVPQDPTNGIVGLPVRFRRTGKPAGAKGIAFRYKLDGETTFTEPSIFINNFNKVVPNLRLKDSGVIQFRYYGGPLGVGPWSEEFPFIVA